MKRLAGEGERVIERQCEDTKIKKSRYNSRYKTVEEEIRPI